MSIFIKYVELKSNLILAPMANFTDVGFRNLCLKFGAGLVCTEMISAKALSYKNKKTEELLATLDDESPKAVQIFGHEPEIMAEAVKNPLLQKFDIIDINMGCPALKIVKNGDGSALLKNFELAKKIITACTNATKKPITVKFRIGFEAGQNVAVEFAKMCEEAGAAAITVHGRTKEQEYSGDVDYATIRAVKEAVSIPVFANGNCTGKESFEKILSETQADGVMIGRASLGHPEIFSEILGLDKFNMSKLDQIKFHYQTLLKFFDERRAILEMRSHIVHYLKGTKNTKSALEKILKLDKFDEIIEILEKINFKP